MEEQVRSTLVRQKFETVMTRLREQTPIEIFGTAAEAGAAAEGSGAADSKN
jgi:hypothetical protein